MFRLSQPIRSFPWHAPQETRLLGPRWPHRRRQHARLKIERVGPVTIYKRGLSYYLYYRQDRLSQRRRIDVVDPDTGLPLACRLYLQAEDGSWFFPKSESATGSAIPYQKKVANQPKSLEMHTTLSAHPFVIDLLPGKYTVTVERGKEYFPLSRQIRIGGEAVRESFPLRRWINMPQRGWYSGDTHVHRKIEELPNLLQAEDLNVAFPLTSWPSRTMTKISK